MERLLDLCLSYFLGWMPSFTSHRHHDHEVFLICYLVGTSDLDTPSSEGINPEGITLPVMLIPYFTLFIR